MDEFISREAFKGKYLCCGYLPEMSEEEFDQFPAADVAPVVRCKDCANSYEGAFGRVCAYSIFVDCTVPDDFYCASSKPKEGAE